MVAAREIRMRGSTDSSSGTTNHAQVDPAGNPNTEATAVLFCEMFCFITYFALQYYCCIHNITRTQMQRHLFGEILM